MAYGQRLDWTGGNAMCEDNPMQPLGSRVCAYCQSRIEVERHHLYSIKDGCPDDLQIWLCRVCHERVHGMQTGGLHHQRLAAEGIARAKALGRYKGRKPMAFAKVGKIHRLRAGGTYPAAIARSLGLARSTVYRILAIKQ
jgi:hypothetical protein